MTRYREAGETTMRDEYTEIGWGLLDASVIYRVTTTAFSIAEGIISTSFWIANKDGTEYKATAYKNFDNGFTAC